MYSLYRLHAGRPHTCTEYLTSVGQAVKVVVMLDERRLVWITQVDTGTNTAQWDCQGSQQKFQGHSEHHQKILMQSCCIWLLATPLQARRSAPCQISSLAKDI